MDLCGFTLIIDDIVLPDGTTCMQQLGGGGPQTLFGFQLISHCLHSSTNVGLAAGVGIDLPEPCKAWLRHIGCDTSGLFVDQLPTPRAWQVFEEDGRRTQVWRVKECDELYKQLRPSFDQLPAEFQSSKHYHLGMHAGHPPMKLLQALAAAAHAQGGLLSVETYTCCDSPLPCEQLTAVLHVTDIFSPNEAEAASIVGPGTPQQLVQRLLAAGARVVTLRMGAEGVLVADRDSNTMWHVPAVPNTQVVDVTGCGNAFCGGFLAGLHTGRSILDSARWGCVAGSIMAEWQGVPPQQVVWQQLTQQAEAKHVLVQTAGFSVGMIERNGLSSSDPGQALPAACSGRSTAVCSLHNTHGGSNHSTMYRSSKPQRLGHSLRRASYAAPKAGRSSRAVRMCWSNIARMQHRPRCIAVHRGVVL